MKRIALLLLTSLLAGIQVQADDFETATEAVKNMGIGWNLGNTLDANNGGAQGVDSETSWGQPVTKPELITMMKEAGFGAIRVPVTWFNHMDGDGKVDPAWMKRVHEVVDYVIDAGLYCIINVHHDTGDHDAAWVVADEDNYTATKERYEGLWKQIAEEFKDYDQHLIFAAYNEMLDKIHSWCFASFAASGQYDATIAETAYKGLNAYAQSFVDVVRATGGNNAQRNLIINTYASANGSGNWNAHLTDVLTKIEKPADTAEGHIAFEVHAYPTLNSYKSEVDDIIKKVNEHLVSKGCPVIIGEWSSSNVDKSPSDYDNYRDKFLEFARYFVEQTKENNIATFYWMGLSDTYHRSVPEFNQADLAQTIAKAYHGDGFEGKYPVPDETQTFNYVVTYKDDWSELFLYGDWNKSNPLKLSEYKGIRVKLDADYTDKLQVKIYGGTGGADSAQPITGTETTVIFDSAETGSDTPIITLQTLIGAQTVTVKEVALVKTDGTEEETKVDVAWGCSLDVVATGIHDVRLTPATTSDAIYNLAGQRITAPSVKGIYIRNGKKYIVK